MYLAIFICIKCTNNPTIKQEQTLQIKYILNEFIEKCA